MMDDLRIIYQGKLISQITTYIWRYIDDKEHPQEAESARKLKKYFARVTPFQDGDSRDVTPSISTFARSASNVADPKLINLFNADPKDWLTNGKTKGERPSEEVELLIAVFGEDRITTDSKYISPLFEKDELGIGDQKRRFHFEFHIDVTSFKGTLSDPDLERSLSYRFNIAFPPRPQLGEATVTHEELESWIQDQDENNQVSNSIYIPVST